MSGPHSIGEIAALLLKENRRPYPTGCTQHCNDGADCTETSMHCQTPPASDSLEAGNVYFPPNWHTSQDTEADTDEPTTWWPVTGAQVAQFWALLAGGLLVTLAAVVLALSYVSGKSPLQVMQITLAWVL